jgi:hypothetical protein
MQTSRANAFVLEQHTVENTALKALQSGYSVKSLFAPKITYRAPSLAKEAEAKQRVLRKKLLRVKNQFHLCWNAPDPTHLSVTYLFAGLSGSSHLTTHGGRATAAPSFQAARRKIFIHRNAIVRNFGSLTKRLANDYLLLER